MLDPGEPHGTSMGPAPIGPAGHFIKAMYNSLVDAITTDPELMVGSPERAEGMRATGPCPTIGLHHAATIATHCHTLPHIATQWSMNVDINVNLRL